MFEKLKINMNRVYPTFVVSTMSSGKSTLINALVGRDLLPSRNRACTARTLAILDNDEQAHFIAHAITADDKYKRLTDVDKKMVMNFNNANDVSEMILEGQIEGVKNSKKSLFIIDTPGINNSMDLNHEAVTKELFDKFNEGLIIYVINAQQIGTYDDSAFLKWTAKIIKEKPQMNIIFVVNKMDLIDPEMESPYEVINGCKAYIEDKGIDNPIIIPVSASNALLFKKILQDIELSDFEEENFASNFKRFKRSDNLSLTDYAIIPEKGDLSKIYEKNNIEFTRAEVYSALRNTGLPTLESVIEGILVKYSKVKAPKITHKRKK